MRRKKPLLVDKIRETIGKTLDDGGGNLLKVLEKKASGWNVSLTREVIIGTAWDEFEHGGVNAHTTEKRKARESGRRRTGLGI